MKKKEWQKEKKNIYCPQNQKQWIIIFYLIIKFNQ